MTTPVRDLALLQRLLIDTLYGAAPDPRLLASIGDRGGVNAEALLSIYRNGTRGTLYQALELSYPAVRHYADADQFRRWARAYVGTLPSVSGDLDRYGADFHDFITHFAPDRPDLSELARLEWLISRLMQAPAIPALDFQRLAGYSAEEQAALCLRLAPRAALFESMQPALEMWQAFQESVGSKHDNRFEIHDRHILLIYNSNDLSPFELSMGEFFWLANFSKAGTLLEATERTLSTYPDFSLDTALIQALTLGTLIPAHHLS
jgi:hypothetical protein